MTKVRKAVFPVAGLGTRILPATKAIPKEMLPIVDKPLIQLAVEECLAAGIEEFIFITGRGKEAIENHFDASPALEQVLERSNKQELLDLIKGCVLEPNQIAYVRQTYPLGLGHAISCAQHLIGDEPFAVILADDLIVSEKPCIAQLIETFEQTGSNVIAAMEVPENQISRYGIVDIEQKEGNKIKAKGVVEKPLAKDAPSNLAIVGRYVLNANVFDFIEKPQKEVLNEIQLTDAIAKTIPINGLYAVHFEGKRYDCGSKFGYIEAIIDCALKRDDMKDDISEMLTNRLCSCRKN